MDRVCVPLYTGRGSEVPDSAQSANRPKALLLPQRFIGAPRRVALVTSLPPVVELIPDLERARNVIERWLRPTIWIATEEAGRGPAGRSRLGATPDLPQSVTWPSRTMADGATHHFEYLLQINLAELPETNTPALPDTGMMWLFEEWNTPDETDQLLVYTGTEPPEATESPGGEQYYIENVVPHTLSFRAGYGIPMWDSHMYTQLESEVAIALGRPTDDFDEEIEEWLRKQRHLLAGDAFAWLFGYTGGIGHSIHDDAAVHRFDPNAMNDWKRRRAMDLSDASRWRNLLTVDSHMDVGLVIGDAGYTAVLIHEDDLAKQDFTRLYVSNESS